MVHGVLLGILFFSKSSNQLHMTVNTHIDTNVPIIFSPLPKKSYTNSSGNSCQESLQAIQQRAVAKRGTTLVEEKKKRIQKKSFKKNTKKKKKKNKPSAKKEEKKIEPKKIEPIKEMPLVTKNDRADAKQPIAELMPENALYVHPQELDALQQQMYIQQEVAQSWSPPAGLSSDLACIMKIVINTEGVITDIAVDQSSGVLIFDTSAKVALDSFTAPKWAYGKELLITFKQ